MTIALGMYGLTSAYLLLAMLLLSLNLFSKWSWPVKAGAIVLWVTDARDLAKMALPRAYEVRYSDVLHTVVINARAKLGQGVAQLGEIVDPADRNSRIVQDATRQGQVTSAIEFFDMPDPMYPDR